MSEIFLSASVPVPGRGSYHETADPYLIQTAVREFVVAVLRHHKIVWGGHPAITPMIWAICENLNVKYTDAVTLYQSRFFSDRFPEETKNFRNVVFTEPVADDRRHSITFMREEMLSRDELVAAVFIGGMEGVEDEYEMFQHFHPGAKVLPVGAPGGAARMLAERLDPDDDLGLMGLNFAELFHSNLSVEAIRNEQTLGMSIF